MRFSTEEADWDCFFLRGDRLGYGKNGFKKRRA